MGLTSLEERRRRATSWRRDRKLGEGAAAITYVGVRKVGRGDQRVALKEIKEELWADPEVREQFWVEAESAASMRHSNIVGILEVDANLGRLVLDLVDGVDLQRLVSAAPGGRLPWDLVALIAHSLARALRHVHRRRRRGEQSGMVHRDVSAANVLISYEGDVKLTDFGLATLIRGPKEPASQTAYVRGKVPYLSPEQSLAQGVDGRSDLFALGVLLFELLVGHRPFDGPTDDDTIHAIRDGRRRRLSEFDLDGPVQFFAIVDRLLAPDREARFPNADALLDELEHLQVPHRERELGRLAQHALPPMTVSFELEETAVVSLRPKRQLRGWVAAAVSVAVVASAGLGGARILTHPAGAADEPDRRSGSPPTTAPSTAAIATSTERSVAPEPPPIIGVPSASAEPSAGGSGPAAPPVLVASVAEPPRAAHPAPVGVADPPRTKPHPAKHATEGVRVLVGSVPLPNVNIWIDGEPMGRGPIDTTLKPGRHVFAAGRDRPEYTVTETVKAGTTLHKVIIQRDQ